VGTNDALLGEQENYEDQYQIISTIAKDSFNEVCGVQSIAPLSKNGHL
jgi:hypothetical protein